MRFVRVPFVFARVTAYRSVLGAVLLITLVVGTVLAALAMYDGRALHEATYQRLDGADTSITVTAQTSGVPGFDAQTDSLRAAADRVLGSVPYTMAGTIWSGALALPAGIAPGSAGHQVVLLAGFENLSAHATLTAGSWPGPPQTASGTDGSSATGTGTTVPAALPLAVATRLHLNLGAELTLTDAIDGTTTRIRITGLYRPADATGSHATASYWDQDQIGATGVQSSPPFTTFGPVAVDQAAFADSAVPAAQATWSVQPSVPALADLDPAVIASDFSTLTTSFQEPTATGVNQVATALSAQLTALEDDRAATRSELEAIAFGLLALTMAALVVSARPLAAQRGPETFLLTLRGRGRRQTLLADLGEAGALGGAAFLASAPAGAVLAALLGREGPLAAGAGPGPALLPAADAWLAAGAAGLSCAVIVLAATARGQGSNTLRPRGARPARLAGAARAGGDLAVLALAAVAYWQLRTLPLVSTAVGSAPSINLLAALAPVLALLAGALLSLRLLPPLAYLADRLADRGRRVGPALSAWQISRRPYQHSGTALLLVLTVAAGTFSFAEHATWLRSVDDQSAYTAGAQVRLDLGGGAPAVPTPAALADSSAVQVATPVLRMTGYNGSTVLALNSSTAPDTVLLPSDQYSASPATLWARLGDGAPAAKALPGRPARIQLSASLGSATAQPATTAAPAAGLADADLTLTLEDADGEFFALPAQALPADGRTHALVFPVGSAAADPLRLAGLSLAYQAPATRTAEDTLAVHGLAVSDLSSGPPPSPTALALGSWAGIARSADLANAALIAKTVAGITPNGPVSLTGGASGGTWAAWSQTFDPGYGPVPDMDVFGNLGGYSPAQATVSFAPAAAETLPALATAAFLQSSDLGVGGISQLTADGVQIPVRIVGTVAEFPTVSGQNFVGGLIVDQDAVQERLLALGLPPLPTAEWWLRTAGGTVPPGVPALAGVTTANALRAALLADPLAAVAQQGLLALGAVAGILAVAALWTAVGAGRRERRGQEAVLAALGLSVRRQTLQQCAERLAVAAPAALIGLGIGAGLAWLLLPYLILTEAATTPVPSTALVLAWGPAVLLAAVVVAGPVLAAAAGAVSRPDPAARLRLMEDL
jgi:hypothetical protein